MPVVTRPLSRFVLSTDAEGINTRKRLEELNRKLKIQFGQVLTDLETLDSIELVIEVITLTGVDITNKYRDLTYAPLDTAFLVLGTRKGPDQVYGVDYTVIAPKRLSWNGLGLDGVLKAGHVLQCVYTRTT